MTIEKILIVDDDKLMRSFLTEALRRKQSDITTAENGQQALQSIKDHTYDVVLTDMKLPDATGLDILKKSKEISPNTIVIVITAYGSIENAVEAMRLGAFNYLIKPFSPDSLEAILEKAREHLSLVEENRYWRQSQQTSSFIAESPNMKKILADIPRIAQSNAAIFITGESGTGKEVVAQAIHCGSNRSQNPFIKVNCAAIPEALLESEFFGHEKGAFTGATARRLGRFELAHKGTLLLDEITEIPLGLQAKMLRVLQEQEFERVGGTKPVKVDVRIISTSNRDVKQAIADKILREDLYYRLNVIPILLPPLRDRREDILPLAKFFIKKACVENHKEVKKLSPAAQQKLLAYKWPGNVRELGNIIERAVVLDNGREITPEHLFIEPSQSKQTAQFSLPVGISLQELEKRLIIETLQAQNNNRTRTAEVLGISIRTLRNKLNEYQLN